jgi:hypothetical protein
VTFPEDYKTTYTKYHTINFPATRQVRYYYANKAALQAAKGDKTLPNGSVLFVEVYSAKLDADKKPVMGSDGFFVPGLPQTARQGKLHLHAEAAHRRRQG